MSSLHNYMSLMSLNFISLNINEDVRVLHTGSKSPFQQKQNAMSRGGSEAHPQVRGLPS